MPVANAVLTIVVGTWCQSWTARYPSSSSGLFRWSAVDSVPTALESALGKPVPTIFILAPVVAYGSEIQQPIRATAAIDQHPRARRAPSAHDQGRAAGLHPDGVLGCACPSRAHLSLTIYRNRRQPHRRTSYGRVFWSNAEAEFLRGLGEIADYLSEYLQLSDCHRRRMH